MIICFSMVIKRKEYVSLVTKSYKEAILGTIDEHKRKYQLQEMFNRGFTSGHIFKEENANKIINHYNISFSDQHSIKVSANRVKNNCFVINHYKNKEMKFSKKEIKSKKTIVKI